MATFIMQLPVEKICVLNTAHITEHDAQLIRDAEAPGKVAEHRSREADFFYPDECQDASREFGFSEHFCALMIEASKQGFSYVSFDAAGAIVEGLPIFDW